MFELIVLHIRENGYEVVFAGSLYTQYNCGNWFYWTMVHSLPTRVILNRKPLPGSEPGGEAKVQTAEPGLFNTKEVA